MAQRKVKPGTPHPTKKGLVMGKNGSYVAKTTYAKQVRAAQAAEAASKKGGAIVKADSSAITKPSNKGGGLAKTGGSQKALPGSNPKALPPGKPGGALKIGKASTGKINVKGALGNVALATLASYVADKANKAANPETWKKKSEELKAAMSKPKPTVKGAGGGQGNRGRNSSTPAKRPVANLPSDYKKTEAAAFKAAEKPKATIKSAAKAPASKPKPKPQGQSKDMGENYRRWAAANPKLAAKLKKGQAGYAELKGNKKPSTPAPASKKGSTSPSSAVKPPAKSKPKPQNFLSLSERMKKKRGY